MWHHWSFGLAVPGRLEQEAMTVTASVALDCNSSFLVSPGNSSSAAASFVPVCASRPSAGERLLRPQWRMLVPSDEPRELPVNFKGKWSEAVITAFFR